jgi:hypothetical protein
MILTRLAATDPTAGAGHSTRHPASGVGLREKVDYHSALSIAKGKRRREIYHQPEMD